MQRGKGKGSGRTLSCAVNSHTAHHYSRCSNTGARSGQAATSNKYPVHATNSVTDWFRVIPAGGSVVSTQQCCSGQKDSLQHKSQLHSTDRTDRKNREFSLLYKPISGLFHKTHWTSLTGSEHTLVLDFIKTTCYCTLWTSFVSSYYYNFLFIFCKSLFLYLWLLLHTRQIKESGSLSQMLL